MSEWLAGMDRLLLGAFADRAAVEGGAGEMPPARRLASAALALGAASGLFLASFALVHEQDAAIERALATMIKVPLLFLLTIAITFPSLYVFSLLARSRRHPTEMLQLLLAATCVILAVLASLGPIAAFFAVCTRSYRFMVLLHFAFHVAAGLIGVAFLRRWLGPAPEAGKPPRIVFRAWIVLFALVGAQMGWVLRPFLGNPQVPFTWLRSTDSNVFAFVGESIRLLLH